MFVIETAVITISNQKIPLSFATKLKNISYKIDEFARSGALTKTIIASGRRKGNLK